MDNQCIVQVKLELGHRAQLRKKPTTEGFTHDWMVFVRGPEQFEIQHFVERVVFRLHQSFPKPKRVCKEPPYKVEESGYAGFIMPIEVHFKNKEEPKRVCFTYDLFLNLEGNPPVNHLRCEKLTFNNPTKDFRRKLIKAGGVMVMPEGAEAVSRPSPDYPMLPTIPLSAFSDPKRTKPSHGSKEASKDGNKVSKPHKVTREHRERSRKDSESKGSSREPEREPGKPPKDASRKPADNKPPKEEKPPPKAAFKEPKLSLKEPKLENASPKGGGGGGGVPPAPEGKLPSKRPPAVESPKLAAKKAKKSSSKPAKGGGGLPATSPRAPSAVAYAEKKPPKEKPGGKAEKAKPEPEAKAIKKPLEVSVVEESNSEEEVSLKSESAPSSPSNSSSSSDSSSDSDFEPSQNHSQGALRCGGPHGHCVRWWRTCSPKSRTTTTAPPGRTRPSRPPPSAETPGSATATATTAPAPASRAERPLPARSCPLLITRSPGGKAPSHAPSRKRSLRKECTIRPTPTSWWSSTGG